MGIDTIGPINNALITNNTITGVDYSFKERLWDGAVATGTQLNNNYFYKSNSGAENGVLTERTIGTLNAEDNWWGASDGPGPVGSGSGIKVSLNVDYDPYLTAGTWYVATTGSDVTGNGSPAYPWRHIQFAIDNANVMAGDTINVAAGTYDEKITIGKANLTLQSESALGAIIKPTTAQTTHGAVVYISADGVTVDGFEIDGTTVCKNGIFGWDTSGLTIKNNKIHGAVNAWDGCGILLMSWGNSGTVYNNLIESNEVYDTGRMGIMVMDHGGAIWTTGNIW